MPITYDADGNCTRCGLPGTGFVKDGICECWTDEDEDALDEFEEHKRRRLAEQNEY